MTATDLLLIITDYGTRTSCEVSELLSQYGEINSARLWKDLRDLENVGKILVKEGLIRVNND